MTKPAQWLAIAYAPNHTVLLTQVTATDPVSALEAAKAAWIADGASGPVTVLFVGLGRYGANRIDDAMEVGDDETTYQ